MTTALVKTLCSVVAVFTTAFPLLAQPNAVRHEEIQVKAPFAMPVIKVPLFPKKDFDVNRVRESAGINRLETENERVLQRKLSQ